MELYKCKDLILKQCTVHKKVLFFFLILQNIAVAQSTFSIQGHFPTASKATYQLKGYEGLKPIVISTAQGKEDGTFILKYPASYVGIAHLYVNGLFKMLFILNKENTTIYWKDLSNRGDMQITGSKEYAAFVKGMKTYQVSEATLAGWHYLTPFYEQDSLKQKMIGSEIEVVSKRFSNYVTSLSDSLWVQNYLMARGLIEQIPKTLETYKWRMPADISAFMNINFKDLKNAGVYRALLEGYTSLVQRFTLEQRTTLLKQAIDKVILELTDLPTVQQEVAQYWFTVLESQRFNTSAEYLAIQMLGQDNTRLSKKSLGMFEQYRKLAIGNTAPNIILDNAKELKTVKAAFKLVVFGASWCPTCQNQYTELVSGYKALKEKHNLEVVYISIDANKATFKEYYKDAPFLTFCDEKSWETQAAKDYFIYATPTYILLDRELKIQMHAQSFAELVTWVAREL